MAKEACTHARVCRWRPLPWRQRMRPALLRLQTVDVSAPAHGRIAPCFWCCLGGLLLPRCQLTGLLAGLEEMKSVFIEPRRQGSIEATLSDYHVSTRGGL